MITKTRTLFDDEFQIIQKIASGAFGEVFEAI